MTTYVAPKCTLYCFLQGKVLAWPTHMTQYVAPKCTLYCSLHGKVSAGPTHITKCDVPKCTLYCFFCKGKCSRGPDIRPKILPRSALCIVFCKGRRGGYHGVVMGTGWPPVAWGRGCLLIGNSDKPFPEGEEGRWKRNLSKPLTP